ncbi:NUDIX hydrolase [Geomicrobium sp. JCM 19039]|uniref:NUDIX hydrolase n=1 Tax=Geomicrobium sp. JCM 19039 TaxID=1460636 RepID=UPI00045F1410|nr:NUDIX hydrolase [Geomicrobium sp. JCM 19039]GAK12849.1 ADP-ribose pyrophosphatase [Geomicrobium sp. JCM 19039]
MTNNEETITKKTVFDGKIIRLEVHDVQLPEGKNGVREVVKHPGAVAVIAVTDDERVPLVRQYRKAPEESLLEIPAGKCEPGEQPIQTAERELLEETGWQAGSLTEIGGFYTSPGFADEFITVFLAENLQQKEQALDEDEYVTVEMWSLNQALGEAMEGKFRDAKTAYSLLYLAANKHSIISSS